MDEEVKTNAFKVKIKATENFQTIETDYFEPLDFEDITSILMELRTCIRNATKDVVKKEEKKAMAQKKPFRKATANQISYLKRLGYDEDTGELSYEEASDIITSLTAY